MVGALINGGFIHGQVIDRSANAQPSASVQETLVDGNVVASLKIKDPAGTSAFLRSVTSFQIIQNKIGAVLEHDHIAVGWLCDQVRGQLSRTFNGEILNP